VQQKSIAAGKYYRGGKWDGIHCVDELVSDWLIDWYGEQKDLLGGRCLGTGHCELSTFRAVGKGRSNGGRSLPGLVGYSCQTRVRLLRLDMRQRSAPHVDPCGFSTYFHMPENINLSRIT
jgi:hypothetical protein